MNCRQFRKLHKNWFKDTRKTFLRFFCFLIQQALSQCKDELESIQKRQVEFVQEASKAGRDLAEVTSELQLQRDRCQELEDEVRSWRFGELCDLIKPFWT